MPDDARPCPRGSGLTSRWANDVRGIPLARVCPKCRREKLSHYRPEVLSGPQLRSGRGHRCFVPLPLSLRLRMVNEWTATCDDRCPECSTSCSPDESEDLNEPNEA